MFTNFNIIYKQWIALTIQASRFSCCKLWRVQSSEFFKQSLFFLLQNLLVFFNCCIYEVVNIIAIFVLIILCLLYLLLSLLLLLSGLFGLLYSCTVWCSRRWILLKFSKVLFFSWFLIYRLLILLKLHQFGPKRCYEFGILRDFLFKWLYQLGIKLHLLGIKLILPGLLLTGNVKDLFELLVLFDCRV